MASDIDRYRHKVLGKFPREFAIHSEVATLLEDTIVESRRTLSGLDAIVLDMLMLQCMKTHATVSLVAQHGLMEDTATLARRLLELSIQMIYIGAEEDARLRRRKAGRYLTYLWRQLPRRIKQRLPAEVRSEWVSISRGYGRYVPKNAKRWGPDFRSMFRDAGADDLYTADYAFLSAIAHGSADHQVFNYARSSVRVHEDRFVPALLIYSTKYYLAGAERWNETFNLIDQSRMDGFAERLRKWQLTAVAA